LNERARQILDRIKEVLKEEFGYEDIHIAAVVASPSKEEAWQLYEIDDEYLNLMLGELEYLKNKLVLIHFFEEAQAEYEEESEEERFTGNGEKPSKRTVRNLDGKVVEILGKNEIRTDRGILKLKDWFYEQEEDTLKVLRESCKVERETEKAIYVKNDKTELWIPKSVIVEGLQ